MGGGLRATKCDDFRCLLYKVSVKPFIISKMEKGRWTPLRAHPIVGKLCNGVKSNERSRQSCGSLEEQSKRADQAVLRSRPCRMDRMVCPLASSAIPSEGVVKAKNGYPHTTERVRARGAVSV